MFIILHFQQLFSVFQLFVVHNLTIKYDGNQTCCAKCLKFLFNDSEIFFGNGPGCNMFDIQVDHVFNRKIVPT